MRERSGAMECVKYALMVMYVQTFHSYHRQAYNQSFLCLESQS